MSSFAELGLAAPILAALRQQDYAEPTPIQAQAIPPILRGRDVQGLAQTGTGKTAAFALPILHRLLASALPAPPRCCRALLLAPTRELASQIAGSLRAYGRGTGLRVALLYGGVPKQRQTRTLAAGIDIVVATPGRLLDHLGDRTLNLDATGIFVLDEADHMLALGFIADIRRIVALLPPDRQNLFFSATMPAEIAALARDLLRDPVQVAAAAAAITADGIEQRVMFTDTQRKRPLLVEILSRLQRGRRQHSRILVFTRTKQGADQVVAFLDRARLPATAIHGDKSQAARERALAAFRDGEVMVLVATDVAARGIDIDDVTHVINFDMPNLPETYVHRVGRTARAGQRGVAISLCDPSERAFLRAIEKLTRIRMIVSEPFQLAA
ncbi:DEAD/DEAH box helicase [Lichenicoccus sp.]|uniref:DEAD/DEAH box helicase n=1 Tax=Lichenicoccus sp. TaxID=2781899 RepID=UPI003D12FB74